MSRTEPKVYSIAAHRGFADALAAGLVASYSSADFGIAGVTLLLPSQRAARSVSEAFIRLMGEQGQHGLLLPRMTVIGDLELDESLGPLLDPLDAGDTIPTAVDPTQRWLKLAEFVATEHGDVAPGSAASLRLSRDMAAVMDRLLVENIAPDRLMEPAVLELFEQQSGHWQDSIRVFAKVQQYWLKELAERGQVDAATRRNLLFRHVAERWKADPPAGPIIAAGVTSAAPELARLLRVISELPQGAVVLPDFDLSMDDAAWTELGNAGAPGDGESFARRDATTHPQYHLKLLLNRMGVNRAEVRQWHRAGAGKAPPERTHAISNLFLPPIASQRWAEQDVKRSLTGVRLMECKNPEHEAQSVALLIREALEEPERRVSLVSPDRSLARRVTAHLQRWGIAADDTGGRPLSRMAAGRLYLLLAEVIAEQAAPVPLMALLGHPLVATGEGRQDWLKHQRALERQLRRPRPEPGLLALEPVVSKAAVKNKGIRAWWTGVVDVLAPLMALADSGSLALTEALDALTTAAEALCGEAIWEKGDGRALARFIDETQSAARVIGSTINPRELHLILRDALEQVAVRPPYGGHPRVAIYGLLESRMTRSDLTICAGLNEGSWPQVPSVDPFLPPAILRALGVPNAEFRIGLAAHDLAGAMGAPEVVLSRARRDASGPAIASRFWLRVEALLGEKQAKAQREETMPKLAVAIDAGSGQTPPYPRPRPMPSADQRKVAISVTALDNLRGDPYQFYAQHILGLRALDQLDGEPSAATKGTAMHEILRRWHGEKGSVEAIANQELQDLSGHPLMIGLWRPRLMAGLVSVAERTLAQEGRAVSFWEEKGTIEFDGVIVKGRADRIDRLEDGSLAIVDYKLGSPPTAKSVEKGFRLQLGLLGLMAQRGAFSNDTETVSAFEYWSLAKERSGDGFGYVTSPVKAGKNKAKLTGEELLETTENFLSEAISLWITGNEPFTAREAPDYPGYSDYDQLMRLDEWFSRSVDAEPQASESQS